MIRLGEQAMNGLNDARVKSVIKKVISGRLTTGQAAAKLGISKQYVNRLKRAYAEKGASAFGHGNKGKARRWRTEAETEERIAGLYKVKYEGFNFGHFLEKLNEEKGSPSPASPSTESSPPPASGRRRGANRGRRRPSLPSTSNLSFNNHRKMHPVLGQRTTVCPHRGRYLSLLGYLFLAFLRF